MNAFGDATMALALFVLIRQTGTLDFAGVFDARPATSAATVLVNLVALGLLGGAVAKSAQMPLHTWLPGRDGGPDAGQRPHPRGDDGDRRRLPDRRTHAIFEEAPHVQDLAAGLGARDARWSPG